jgi:hypothetical protein
MFSKVIKKIKEIFYSVQESSCEDDYTTSDEIYFDSSKFYDKDDLVFFKRMNAYGAFKYPIVKKLFNNDNADIGVSTVALDINSIYFSKDEEIHKLNKKAAINHLTFLSTKLQYLDNEYTLMLFTKFLSNLPKNRTVDLVDYLINPIVLINILKEYDLLESIFDELNPESSQFSFDYAITTIRDFFEDTDRLQIVVKNYLENGGILPEKMLAFLEDLTTEDKIERSHLPNFFRSIIFVAVETTASFISSFIYVIFTKYPSIVKEKDSQRLYKIANEVLRIYPSVPCIFRTIWKDTVFSGIALKKGSMLMLFVGAANLDSEYFEDPYQIKEDRLNKHLSFGGGSYTCIGRFASFRMTMNMVDYLAPHLEKISFVDENPQHYFQNAILKLPLNIVYHDK